MTTKFTKSTLLKNARVLIETPEKWVQHTYARNAQGVKVDELSPDAACFCSMGAVYRAASDLGGVPGVVGYTTAQALDLLRNAASMTADEDISVARFNDTFEGGHPAVMQMFDKAIGWAEQEEA